jgi:hypothetical protein
MRHFAHWGHKETDRSPSPPCPGPIIAPAQWQQIGIFYFFFPFSFIIHMRLALFNKLFYWRGAESSSLPESGCLVPWSPHQSGAVLAARGLAL